MPQQSAACNYCFTWNNYVEDWKDVLTAFYNAHCTYLIGEPEIAPTTGTAHIQGYFQLQKKARITALSKILSGVHFEVAKGTAEQNRAYCTKEAPADVLELGTPAHGTGKCLVGLKKGIQACKTWDDVLTLIEGTPQYLRYAQECFQNKPFEPIENVTLRTWQAKLHKLVETTPRDDRAIWWIYDPNGGKGKSFYARYLLHNCGAYYCRPSRSADIVYAYRNQPIVIYDIPKTVDDEYLNYGSLEMMKDGLIFSPKYMSCTKSRGDKSAHILVFSNKLPDTERFAEGRLHIINLINDEWPEYYYELVKSDTVSPLKNDIENSQE